MLVKTQDMEKGLDSIALQILLREEYEQDYHIFDHQAYGEQRPLSLVAHNSKEDVGELSGLYRVMWRYTRHGIYSKFGLNLEQFLDLPRDICEMLFKIATDETIRKGSQIDETMAGLQEQLKETKK